MGLPSAGGPVKSARGGSVPRWTACTGARVHLSAGLQHREEGDGGHGSREGRASRGSREIWSRGDRWVSGESERSVPYLRFTGLHRSGLTVCQQFRRLPPPRGLPRSRTCERTHGCGRCLPLPASGNQGCSAPGAPRGLSRRVPGGGRDGCAHRSQ